MGQFHGQHHGEAITDIRENSLPQVPHVNGFSCVWIRMCLVRCSFLAKHRQQRVQVRGVRVRLEPSPAFCLPVVAGSSSSMACPVYGFQIKEKEANEARKSPGFITTEYSTSLRRSGPPPHFRSVLRACMFKYYNSLRNNSTSMHWWKEERKKKSEYLNYTTKDDGWSSIFFIHEFWLLVA